MMIVSHNFYKNSSLLSMRVLLFYFFTINQSCFVVDKSNVRTHHACLTSNLYMVIAGISFFSVHAFLSQYANPLNHYSER